MRNRKNIAPFGTKKTEEFMVCLFFVCVLVFHQLHMVGSLVLRLYPKTGSYFVLQVRIISLFIDVYVYMNTTVYVLLRIH